MYWNRARTILQSVFGPRTLRSNSSSSAPQRTAFLLLGGGARGAAQAGALSVLLNAGIIPDLFIGISAGAWNSVYLASDPTAERARDLEALWKQTTSRDVLGSGWWSAPLNAVASRVALYGDAGVRRLAQRFIADTTFEELKVPTYVVTTELETGNARVFYHGRALDPVLASSAIPGIFPPVRVDDTFLVDGGLAEWEGSRLAIEMGATRVFLVACGSVFAPVQSCLSFRSMIERSMEITNKTSFASTVYALQACNVEVIPVYPQMTVGSILDFDHAESLVSAGRLAAKEALNIWQHSQTHVDDSAEIGTVKPESALCPSIALSIGHR